MRNRLGPGGSNRNEENVDQPKQILSTTSRKRIMKDERELIRPGHSLGGAVESLGSPSIRYATSARKQLRPSGLRKSLSEGGRKVSTQRYKGDSIVWAGLGGTGQGDLVNLIWGHICWESIGP